MCDASRVRFRRPLAFLVVVVAIATATAAFVPPRMVHAFMVHAPALAHALHVDAQCLDTETRVRCRFIDAPLDPDAPDGEQIRIATFYARAPDRAKVRGLLLFDIGGPDRRFQSPDPVVVPLVKTFDGRYDVAAIDLRGMGASERFPPCEPMTRAYDAIARAPREERPRIWRTFVDESAVCSHEGSLRMHVSLRALASDVDAVRRAFGAERVAVIGTSYGGALALAYGLHHAEHTDALVIDSPLTYGLLDDVRGFGLTPDAVRALDDAGVRALAETLRTGSAVASTTDDAILPVIVMLAETCLDWDTCPVRERPIARLLDGLAHGLKEPEHAVVTGLTAADLLRRVTHLDSTRGEDARKLITLLADVGGGRAPHPHGNGTPLATPDERDGLLCGLAPRAIHAAIEGSSLDALLRAHDAGRGPRRTLPCLTPPEENPPYTLADLDVPVVFFAGDADWLTPIATTRAYARAANAPLVVVPGGGHGVLFVNKCTHAILRRALNDRVVPDSEAVCTE
jgi:pimeloyl-ACP methyl ester carboxylesterase